MACPLRTGKPEDRQEMTDVKTRGCGIEASVNGEFFTRQRIPRALGGVVDEAAPLQLAIEVHQPLL